MLVITLDGTFWGPSYPDIRAVYTIEVDLGPIWQCRAKVRPRTLHGRRAMSADTSARRKAVVFPIRDTLDHTRVMGPAIACAGTPVGVCAGKRSKEKRNKTKHYV